MRITHRTPTIAAAAVTVALAGVLSACGAGVNAATNVQGPSGNGATINTGPLEARGLVLVEGSEPGAASLVGTVVNVGTQDDAITSVTVDASTATISTMSSSPAPLPTLSPATGGSPAASPPLPLPQRSRIQFGYPTDRYRIAVTGLAGGLSTFHDVTITYRIAGTAKVQVLGVPDTGIWSGLGPSALAAS